MTYIRGTNEERFWARVRKSDGCWEWTGTLSPCGYGRFDIAPPLADRWHSTGAHRVAWMLTHGPIPEGEGHHGTCVLHRCDNPKCVRPDHLFLGTQSENMADKTQKGRAIAPNKGKSHCKYGHPRTPENLTPPFNGRSGCKVCRRKGTRGQRDARDSERAA